MLKRQAMRALTKSGMLGKLESLHSHLRVNGEVCVDIQVYGRLRCVVDLLVVQDHLHNMNI